MTDIQNIHKPSTTPQRSDPENFRSDADTWIDEFNNQTVPNINTAADNMETLQTDVTNKHSDVDTWHAEAETYRDDAYGWAETPEDTEFTDSEGRTGYASYHWAQKSAKGERLTATSSTSISIGTGSKTLTLNESYRAFTTGSKVRVVYGGAATTSYMEGIVTGYDDSIDSLTIDVTNTGGSGTYSDWYIALNNGGDADTLNGYKPSGIARLGGANARLSQSSNITLSASDDQVQVFSFTGKGYTTALPDATTLLTGTSFIISNYGNDYAFGIRDNGGNLLASAHPKESYECYLTDNSTANGIWYFGPPDISRVLEYNLIAFNSVSSEYMTIVNLDDSTLVAVYKNQDDSNNRCEAVAISASDGSVLSGPIGLNSNDAHDIASTKLSSTEIFVCYRDNDSSDFKAVVVEYTSGTLSKFAGPTQISTVYPDKGFGCVALDSSNVGICLGSGAFDVMVVNWNGSNISVSTGPTEINSDSIRKIECAFIDSTHFLCVYSNNTNSNSEAAIIYWDSGASSLSKADSITLGNSTNVRSNIQIALIEDDGTYLWFAAFYSNSENANSEADLATFSVNQSDYRLSNYVIKRQVTSFRTDDALAHRYNAFAIANKIYLLAKNEDKPKYSYLIKFNWDSINHILDKEEEIRVLDVVGSESSITKIGTNDIRVAFENNDNNGYGTSVKMEFAT